MCQLLSHRLILQDVVAKIECELASTRQDQHGWALTSYPRSWTAGWFIYTQSDDSPNFKMPPNNTDSWVADAFDDSLSTQPQLLENRHDFQFALLRVEAPFQWTQDIRSALQAGQRVPDALVSWAKTCEDMQPQFDMGTDVLICFIVNTSIYNHLYAYAWYLQTCTYTYIYIYVHICTLYIKHKQHQRHILKVQLLPPRTT